jgi:two-component system repressor protein LuxO
MKNDLPNVVIVDDEVEILNALKRVVRKFDCHIHTFHHPQMALDFIKENSVRVICTDQRMPDMLGIELLKTAMEISPSTQRIMLSAYQDFDNIAQGFNDGTIQRFIAKPWNNKELETVFTQILSVVEPPKANTFSHMIGASRPMKKLFSLIQSAAGANVPIFVHGATGTGKELVAKACHTNSYRAESAFIAINCANLSEHLIESQLFGHKKGAFTGAIKDQPGYFELAGKGTLFLDEITTLPLSLQAKLLRVIQEREYIPIGASQAKEFNAQVVSASSTRLSDAVQQGEFREDLYYRLAVIQLKIPRLCEREQDIMMIANHYLQQFSQEHHKDFTGFDTQAIEYILAYEWPGNIRQLENLLHGVIILNNGALISKDMLTANMNEASDMLAIKSALPSTEPNFSSEIQPLAEVEKSSILSAIAQCNGNIVQASKLLEVNPSTIYRKMSKW